MLKKNVTSVTCDKRHGTTNYPITHHHQNAQVSVDRILYTVLFRLYLHRVLRIMQHLHKLHLHYDVIYLNRQSSVGMPTVPVYGYGHKGYGQLMGMGCP